MTEIANNGNTNRCCTVLTNLAAFFLRVRKQRSTGKSKQFGFLENRYGLITVGFHSRRTHSTEARFGFRPRLPGKLRIEIKPPDPSAAIGFLTNEQAVCKPKFLFAPESSFLTQETGCMVFSCSESRSEQTSQEIWGETVRFDIISVFDDSDLIEEFADQSVPVNYPESETFSIPPHSFEEPDFIFSDGISKVLKEYQKSFSVESLSEEKRKSIERIVLFRLQEFQIRNGVDMQAEKVEFSEKNIPCERHGCKNTFEFDPHVPHKSYCSTKCFNAMRAIRTVVQRVLKTTGCPYAQALLKHLSPSRPRPQMDLS